MPGDDGTPGLDPGEILEHLGVVAMFADPKKILRYINREASETRPDIRAVLNRSLDDCHQPASVATIDRLYDAWRAGGREVVLYRRVTGDGEKHNLLVPVHGPAGFQGVVELVFTLPVQSPGDGHDG